jgi:hypothetical protein
MAAFAFCHDPTEWVDRQQARRVVVDLDNQPYSLDVCLQGAKLALMWSDNE